MRSLSSTPGRNFTTLRAAILIGEPFRGSRPMRALFFSTENVPNPDMAIRSPSDSVFDTMPMKASRLFRASIFERPVSSAMASASCFLFMFRSVDDRFRCPVRQIIKGVRNKRFFLKYGNSVCISVCMGGSRFVGTTLRAGSSEGCGAVCRACL